MLRSLSGARVRMALWWGLAAAMITLMLASGWAKVESAAESDARAKLILPQMEKVRVPNIHKIYS